MSASIPCLVVHGTQRGKSAMSRRPTSACLASQASMRGVSNWVFRLMPSSSWPASMRSRYCGGGMLGLWSGLLIKHHVLLSLHILAGLPNAARYYFYLESLGFVKHLGSRL